ncbi:hypothetical protein [Lysobacter panacisoli]|uniref:hypothetical protein n=1 Tax=Lysobacter panacisoli TaxID=1255263 RepID=UPI00131DAF1E|nr:hypothetical protein [Lysobacter panacisoli]
MKSILLSLMLCLTACTPSKSSSRLHSVDMDIDGPRVYDYRIDYGKTVLPGGNRGDSDFGGGRTYMARMPLPEVAVATWRTAPAPDGVVVRFVVPIRDQVTDEEWQGELFTLEFLSTPTTLKVNVLTGITGDKGHPRIRRQIYSGTATSNAP